MKDLTKPLPPPERDPFASPAPDWWPKTEPPWIYATVMEDQLKIVATADADKLRAILEHPWAGITVRQRAAARLRKLTRVTRSVASETAGV